MKGAPKHAGQICGQKRRRNIGAKGMKEDSEDLDSQAKVAMPPHPLLQLHLDETRNPESEKGREVTASTEEGQTIDGPHINVIQDNNEIDISDPPTVPTRNGARSSSLKICSHKAEITSNIFQNMPGIDKNEWLSRFPPQLKKLVFQARSRGVNLLLMPSGMERRKSNTTSYNSKRDKLSWRVEFMFHLPRQSQVRSAKSSENDSTSGAQLEMTPKMMLPLKAAANISILADRVPETVTLTSELTKHILARETRSQLKPFYTAGEAGVHLLMKKMPCSSRHPLYTAVDKGETLVNCLRGSTIIEYPTFHVVLCEDLGRFPRTIEEV